jgi:hypothetical protein
MPGKRFLGVAAVLVWLASTGCCAWCDRWCPNRQAVAYGPPVYAAPPAAPANCCCVPVCCTPAATSGYPAAQPASTWSRPGGACPCP